jgi:anti-sigma factor RsiW
MDKRGCILEQSIEAYLLGDLPDRLLEIIGQHLSSCPVCQAQASRLDDLADPTIQAIRQAVRRAAPPQGDGSRLPPGGG